MEEASAGYHRSKIDWETAFALNSLAREKILGRDGGREDCPSTDSRRKLQGLTRSTTRYRLGVLEQIETETTKTT
jgi:hypothetical protein